MIRRLLIIITFLTLTFPVAQALAADTTNVTVNATILDGGFCILPASASLSFGGLDPANPVNVNASTTIDIFCIGFPIFSPVVYLMGDDDGLHETGLNSPRMQHTVIPTEYLPYTMSIVPFSASIPSFTVITIDIDGTVLAADYQGSTVATGDYEDTVIINIIP